MLNVVNVLPSAVTLRAGTPDDAEACAAICFDAFRTIAGEHNFPSDFPAPEAALDLMHHALSCPYAEVAVAEADGRVLGSNVLWSIGPVAGVGPITVAPDVQNIAIGKRLMQWLFDSAARRGAAGVRLVQAAYHCRSLSLYTKLGFDAREALSVLQGEPLGVAIPGHAVRAARPEDLSVCNALCTAVHGHDRADETADAITRGIASLVEFDGRVTAYTTTVGFFGHTVAESNEGIKALIGAAAAFPGPGMLIPTRNGELLRWCLAHGLRVVQPLTLMSRGLYQEPDGKFLPSILF